jgi:hypothetical protein
MSRAVSVSRDDVDVLHVLLRALRTPYFPMLSHVVAGVACTLRVPLNCRYIPRARVAAARPRRASIVFRRSPLVTAARQPPRRRPRREHYRRPCAWCRRDVGQGQRVVARRCRWQPRAAVSVADVATSVAGLLADTSTAARRRQPAPYHIPQGKRWHRWCWRVWQRRADAPGCRRRVHHPR